MNSPVVDAGGCGDFLDIASAITAVQNSGFSGSIVITPGTYTLFSCLCVPAGIGLEGTKKDGVTLLVPNNAQYLPQNSLYAVIHLKGNGASVKNLIIQGNRTQQTQQISAVSAVSTVGLFYDVQVENVKSVDSSWFGFHLYANAWGMIRGCRVENAASRAFFFEKDVGSTCTRNTALGGGTTGVEGIHFEIDNSSGYTKMDHNISQNSALFGFGIGGQSQQLWMTENTSINSYREGFQITSANFAHLKNNTVSGTQADYGISLDGSTWGVQFCEIAGNQIIAPYKNGICAIGTRGCEVIDNIIYDSMAQGTQGGMGAITLTGGANRNLVKNNHIFDDRIPKKHVYGIYEDSSCDWNQLNENEVFGYLTLPVYKSGANSTALNNLSALT